MGSFFIANLVHVYVLYKPWGSLKFLFNTLLIQIILHVVVHSPVQSWLFNSVWIVWRYLRMEGRNKWLCTTLVRSDNRRTWYRRPDLVHTGAHVRSSCLENQCSFLLNRLETSTQHQCTQTTTLALLRSSLLVRKREHALPLFTFHVISDQIIYKSWVRFTKRRVFNPAQIIVSLLI